VGIAIGTCVDCGRPVARKGRQHCCWCMRRIREATAKSPCPGCGRQRVLQPDSGRCRLCSHRCVFCGGPLRFVGSTHCRACRRRIAAAAAKAPCPRCGRPGLIRESTGWCGPCSRPAPATKPPRVCRSCGQLRRHCGLGMCSACWQRHPDRPFIRATHLIATLPDPPDWLGEFAAHVAGPHTPSRAAGLVTGLGRLLRDGGPTHPQALLERACRTGRSMGTLAKVLQDFFTARGLALPADHSTRLAAGRRQRRVDAVPAPLRPAVAMCAEHLVQAQQRARRAGTRPRTDSTLDSHLANVRDHATYLATARGKTDWATVDVHDVEAFLAVNPAMRKSRLIALRQFFRLARHRRVVLVDPTRELTTREPWGFRGKTVQLPDQRHLFLRWSTSLEVHPNEAVVGLLALLHGASCQELRGLTLDDVDHTARSVHLGHRPSATALDPVTWTALQRCLDHRQALATTNPHVIVTKVTKTTSAPASPAYLSHVLDPAGVAPKHLRNTRLVDLVHDLDPKLVAAVFGMDSQAALPYLADHVDPTRLPGDAELADLTAVGIDQKSDLP
jgi:site-specific recombinase XerD